MKKRKSPQEKKRLSYSKDRRNWYGENDKSSRKNIPRSKRIQHRSHRHRHRQQLSAAVGAVDESVEAALGERLAQIRRRKWWRKSPDEQLGVYVAGKLAARNKKGVPASQKVQARIKKVRRITRLDGLQPRR